MPKDLSKVVAAMFAVLFSCVAIVVIGYYSISPKSGIGEGGFEIYKYLSKYIKDHDFVEIILYSGISITIMAAFIFSGIAIYQWQRDPLERQNKLQDHSVNIGKKYQATDHLGNGINLSDIIGNEEFKKYLEKTLNLDLTINLYKRMDDYMVLFSNYTKVLNLMGFKNASQLAASEIFTEKAQLHVSDRAKQYYAWAIIFVIMSLMIVFIGLATIKSYDLSSLIKSFTDIGGGDSDTKVFWCISSELLVSAAYLVVLPIYLLRLQEPSFMRERYF